MVPHYYFLPKKFKNSLFLIFRHKTPDPQRRRGPREIKQTMDGHHLQPAIDRKPKNPRVCPPLQNPISDHHRNEPKLQQKLGPNRLIPKRFRVKKSNSAKPFVSSSEPSWKWTPRWLSWTRKIHYYYLKRSSSPLPRNSSIKSWISAVRSSRTPKCLFPRHIKNWGATSWWALCNLSLIYMRLPSANNRNLLTLNISVVWRSMRRISSIRMNRTIRISTNCWVFSISKNPSFTGFSICIFWVPPFRTKCSKASSWNKCRIKKKS